MSTREQFGDYLLLKKLTEDPLGETFRAGKLGAKGMERVALLRVFNGEGLDGQRLWAGARERSGIQQLLRGPNLGEGIEMGEIQGIPYVAYDYISGKNLATLLQQVTKKRSAIPTEHGLLITERIALGLALAAENRYDGKRIHHGFVIPHLVMISNEGESRLLGFEVGPGLRAFAANPVGRRHFGRYLAPEALTGAPLEPADDIYSLGVILLELLTGKPLPAPASDGFGPIIEQARLADEGGAIPAPLQQLLRASLVPKEHRLQDVAAWHKTLNQWMFEGKYNPTTFNLAFFMHNLFRQDIERESEEIEVEKTLPLPVATPTPAPLARTETTPAPTPAPSTDSATVASPVTMPITIDPAASTDPATAPATTAPAAEPGAGGGARKGLWIALAAVLLLAAAGGVWWWLDRASGGPIAGTAAAAPLATAPDRDAGSAAISDSGLETDAARLETGDLRVASADEAEVTEEAEMQLQAQIDSLVEQKASAMESQLREQMDSQLEALRKQLESAQAEADAREKELLAQKAKADQEARAKAAEEETARLAEEERLRLEAEAAAAAEAEKARLAEEEAARLAAEQTAAAAAPPPPPAVRRGDLVEPGPGIGVPKLVRIPPARFPEMARRLNKTDVEVVVRVLVDENGDVLEARLPNKKVGFGFDTEALKVARKATYEPARAGNVPVKMWAVVRVKFQG